jgi:hypothetical protein
MIRDVADEAAAAVADGSVEALLAVWSRERDTASNPVHEAIRRRNVGALRLILEQSSWGSTEVCEVYGLMLTPLQLCLGLHGPEVARSTTLAENHPLGENRHFARLPRALCFTREVYALAELLLEHQADANVCGRSGITPLQAAVRNLHQPLVDLLLHAGARANEQAADSTGYGPLHMAAIFCNCGPESGKAIIRSLLEARANPTLTCDGGLVPRAYSMDREVKEMLLREELWWRRRVLAWVRSANTSFVADLPETIAWSVAQFL